MYIVLASSIYFQMNCVGLNEPVSYAGHKEIIFL